MKALWITLAVLAGLGLLCCGGFMLMGKGLFDSAAKLNNEADVYSKQIFEKAAANWDASVLMADGSPEFQKQVPEEKLKAIFEVLKDKLGKFKSVGEFTSNNISTANNNGESHVIVKTKATGLFEKDSGQVSMEVIKRGETWKVLAFEVQSESLKEKQ